VTKTANALPIPSIPERAEELSLLRKASGLLLEVVIVECRETCITVPAVGSSIVSTTTSKSIPMTSDTACVILSLKPSCDADTMDAAIELDDDAASSWLTAGTIIT